MRAYQFPEKQANQIIEEVCQRQAEQFFQSKKYITGEELLHFSDHEQVNRFLLYQVRQELNKFVNHLDHPYFDVQAPEVREAIQGFRNILSRHIHIQQTDFGNLHRKAVYNTLRLILNPSDTFQRFFFSNRDELSTQIFGQYIQYFSDFDFLLQGILGYHQKHELSSIRKEVFEEKIEKIAELYEQKTGRSTDAYRKERFQSLTGYELSRFSTKSHDYATAKKEQRSGQAPSGEEAQFGERDTPAESGSSGSSEGLADYHGGSNIVSASSEASLQALKQEVQAVRQQPQQPATGASQELFQHERQEQQAQPAATNAPQQARQQASQQASPNEQQEGPAQQPRKSEPTASKPDASSRQSQQASTRQQSEQQPAHGPDNGQQGPAAEASKQSASAAASKPSSEQPSSPSAAPPPEQDSPKAASEGQGEHFSVVRERSSTLADRYQQGEQPSRLNDRLKEQGKGLTVEQIPLHKQFQFVQKVFSGDSQLFRKTIEALSQCQNAEEAQEYLDTRILNRPEVSREDKVTQEFEQLIQSQFQDS